MSDNPELKRTLSLAQITFYGLGTILGAGIYVLVGKVAGTAGLYAPLAFVVAALLAGLTGLSYAELAARHPKSAGEAVYVQDGFRWRPLSMLVGFLIILTGIVSAATIANGFVGYLHVFIDVPDWLAITLLVLALGALAAWGIAESVMAATAITLVEVGGLLLVLAVAGGSFADLPARLPELIPPFEVPVWQGILLGAFLAFYAFIGFEDMANVAEEVRHPAGVVAEEISRLRISRLRRSQQPIISPCQLLIHCSRGGLPIMQLSILFFLAPMNKMLPIHRY